MTMVENSFDWWRKDVFFSAAEEVQESADTMESLYRAWEREGAESFQSNAVEELRRELQIALGIAKWQLEEFEKAVKLSHRSHMAEKTVARHAQFIAAIDSQVSRIERAFSDSVVEEKKQPLRWVQLDKDERDDLALFLSGSAESSQDIKGILCAEADVSKTGKLQTMKRCKEAVILDGKVKYGPELASNDPPDVMGKIESPRENSTVQKQLLSLPEIDSWKITIDENSQNGPLKGERRTPNGFSFWRFLRSVELVARFKLLGKKMKDSEDVEEESVSGYSGLLPVTQGTNESSNESMSFFGACFRHSSIPSVRRLAKRVGGFHRQAHSSECYVKISASVQVYLILVLLIFLIVPCLIYVS